MIIITQTYTNNELIQTHNLGYLTSVNSLSQFTKTELTREF